MTNAQKRAKGRPKLTDGEKSSPVSIRLSKSQHAAYMAQGGAKWFRAWLDKLRQHVQD